MAVSIVPLYCVSGKTLLGCFVSNQEVLSKSKGVWVRFAVPVLNAFNGIIPV